MARIVTMPAALAVLSTPTARQTAHARPAGTPIVVGAAIDIPGLIRDGTAIERILTGFGGLDDPIGLTDGSLVFSEPGAGSFYKVGMVARGLAGRAKLRATPRARD